jgi:pimeloyl-ACP methyl ester carboxylesterase
MKTVRSEDGTSIAYWQNGTGDPLLLVHGTASDHTTWAQVQPTLERHFSVHVVDRRGRGHSGDAPAYSHKREGEDIASVIDAIGGPVNVVAHSFGALCTLRTAAILGWTGAAAPGADGIGFSNLRRQSVFDADLVAPRDVQVVLIDKPRTLTEPQRRQRHVR